jgi:hypothetical protein
MFCAALAATFLAVPAFMVNLVRFFTTRSKPARFASRSIAAFPIKSAALLVLSTAAVFASGAGAISTSRREVLAFLQQPPTRLRVHVNGAAIENSEPIILCLRSIANSPAHHSHATTVITIDIYDAAGRTLSLELGRDSQNPREYWVFVKKTSRGLIWDIGSIRTPLFDAYQP